MNKDQLRLIRKQMSAALADIEKETGVTFNVGNITYTENSAKVTVKVCTQDKSGNVISPEADAFRVNAMAYGLMKEDLFKEITLGGKRYKITGLKTRARKKPIMLQDVLTEKNYVVDEQTVQRCLAERRL